ncbi:hypothetical protein IFM89_022933 [Coptis chinensis]|uniref:Pectinesterase n=1 Tax=Coptis chinensis TaxID=261450 RepID=A0A835LN66_9MAGN|nr:hypothetical protein IFM89_022933 [Coptis chinensis]
MQDHSMSLRDKSSAVERHKVFFCKVYNKAGWGDILGNDLGYIFKSGLFLLCLDGIINPSGWMDWGDPSRRGFVWLGEYKCKGRGADLRRQVPWAISFRDEEARPFLDRNFNSLIVVEGESPPKFW